MSGEGKELLIYKQNPLIEAHIPDYTETGWSVINALIAVVQDIFKEESLFSAEELSARGLRLPMRQIREQARINSSDYIQQIDTVLKELGEKEITYRNYTDPETGQRVRVQRTRVIAEYTLFDDGYRQFADIQFTKHFLQLALRDFSIKFGNYTKVPYLTSASIRGAYAKLFYEWMLSKRNLGKYTLRYNEAKELMHKDMPFAHIVRQLSRDEAKILPFIKFSWEADKIHKEIRFSFE